MSEIKLEGQGAGLHTIRAFGGQLRMLTGELHLSNDYPAGGEDFDLTSWFAKFFGGVIFEARDGYVVEYLPGEKKAKVISIDDGNEATGDLTDVGDISEQQEVFVVADGGTYKLGTPDGTKETDEIAHNATANTVETRLNALDGYSNVSVERSGEPGAYKYVITYEKSLGDSDIVVTDTDLTDFTDPEKPARIEFTIIRPFQDRGIKFMAWGY